MQRHFWFEYWVYISQFKICWLNCRNKIYQRSGILCFYDVSVGYCKYWTDINNVCLLGNPLLSFVFVLFCYVETYVFESSKAICKSNGCFNVVWKP